MAAVLGFVCEFGDKLIAREERGDLGNNNSSRVAVCTGERVEMQLNNEGAAVQTGAKKDDHSASVNSLLWPHSKSLGLERKRFSTNATEFEIATCNQAVAPRVRRSRLLHSPMSSSSRSSRRRSRRSQPANLGMATPHTGPVLLHWGIALVAMAELVLSAIHNKQKES